MTANTSTTAIFIAPSIRRMDQHHGGTMCRGGPMRSRYLVCAVLLSVACFAQPPSAETRAYFQRRDAEATALYAQKQYAKAAAIHEEMRNNPAIAKIEEAMQRIVYNLACEYSLAGEKEKALATVREAIAINAG